MAEDNNNPTTRLGDIPSKIRIRTPEEIAAARQQGSRSQSLIGGKDSSWAGSFLGNVVEGAASVVASPFKAMDRALAAAAGTEYREDVASPISKLGKGIEDVAGAVASGDPERAEDFSSKLGQGLGSTAGFLVPGAILGAGARGAAGIAALGGAATGVEQAEDYEGTVRAAGGTIDPTKQGQALFAGMLPGTIEAVPLVKMLGRMDDIVKGGLSAAVKNTAKGTVEEALQEGIQSTAQNLIASDLIKYDPERNMFFDTPEAAAVGGGVGFLMNSVMSALGLRQRGKYNEAAIKAIDSARKEAGAVEEEQAKVNPATGEAIENSDIAKTHKLIQRYTRLGETDPIESNRKAYQSRVEELQQELRTKYFTKDAESGEYTSSAADRQEATDVLTSMGVEEVEQVEAAPAPFKGDVDVAEAEPFPTTEGIRVNKDITNPQRLAKFNRDLERLYPTEEITITGLEEAFPTAEGISVEEINPIIEEIDLGTTTTPSEKTYFEDRPRNLALADQLQRIKEQGKRRDETDAAFEARKEAEITEAYRQRELQLAEQGPTFETKEEDIQPATTQSTNASATEQAQEAVLDSETQTGIVPKQGIITKSGTGFKSEAIAKASMKRQGIDGTVIEYASGQFAIVPNVEDTLQADIEMAKAATRRQAGIDIAPVEGPVDLRRQAGLPEDLNTLPSSEITASTDELIPSLRDREGIPTPNGPVNEDGKPENIKPIKRTETSVDPVARDAAIKETSRTKNDPVQLRDITTKAGHPFKTATIAKAQLNRRKLANSHDIISVDGGFVLRPKAQATNTINDVVDDEAGYEASGKELSSGTVEGVVTAPVEKQEQIPLDPEVYDEVVRLAEAMKTSENPQRFVPAIEKEFETVKQFLAIHSGIEAGYIVRKGENTTEVVATPAGTVETNEETIKNPAETVKMPSEAVDGGLDEVERRLSEIDISIQDLQDEIDSGYAESVSDLTKQIARLKLEQKDLEKQQQGLYGEKQSISKREEDELVELNGATIVDESLDDITPEAKAQTEARPDEVNTTKARPDEVNAVKKVVNMFKSQMDKERMSDLDITVVTNINDIPKELLGDYQTNWEGKLINGLHYPKREIGGKANILIFPRAGRTREDAEWTIYHETVGHYGFKKIFGNAWNRYLDILLENPELASKAFALSKRWSFYKDKLKPIDQTSENAVKFKPRHEYVFDDTLNATDRFAPWKGKDMYLAINRSTMRALMEEYLAEIAGNMSRKTFRDATKQERSLINRIKAWIKHTLRKAGFGNIVGKISDGEVIAMIGESYARIKGEAPAFETPGIVNRYKEELGKYPNQLNPDQKIKVSEIVDQIGRDAAEQIERINRLNGMAHPVAEVSEDGKTVSPSAALIEAQVAMNEAIDQAVNLGHIVSKDEGRKILKSIIAREGRLDNSAHHRRVERVSDWIRRTKVGKVMSSNGHLPFVRVLNAIENWTKGGIEKGQLMARKYARKTRDLNDIQKKAIFDYFKTKNADVSGLPVSEEIKQLSKQNKDYIEKLGESLVVMGVLRRETWEADRGSYLTIRYFHYLEGYYATGGKRMSFQNYLKQQKGLSKEEKAALGEIKDPSFLVPETVATISRDVALNGMFKNIITMDEVGKLGWTLGERQFTEVDGKKMKLSDIEKKIESLTFLKDAQSDLGPLYKDEQDQQAIEAQLQLYMDARTAAKNALRDEVRQVLAERGETEITQDMINHVIDREYVQVNDKRYGALHKKYIRKELYDEIIDSSQFYDKEHADFFGKAFGAGGYADRANQRWKSLKVTLNPPSWFRNGMGNLILMDIGTNTSMGKLIGMTVDEVNSWIKGNPSKYFQIAHDNGLWATTYSAAELNLMSQQFQDAFKGHVTINTERNFMKKAWWMFDEKLSQIFEKGTEIYGNMEGFFKTVALRDYIQRWEKQSGTKLDDADANTREAVIREAVEAANNNIFDYSKVPGWMRTMRRRPFVGAPFLTYTFKAFPYVMESFARRPQKFIKYMALPYVMAQAFMANQDLDDDDYEEIMRMLPKWQKEKSSIYLLPWKDSNGNFQTIDFGYYLPWAPFQNLSLMAANTFDMQNPLLSTGNVALNLGTDLGFLGGPLPQMISAAITNKDPFSGREIVRTAGTTLDKQNDFMRYMVDMWTPTFLTSKGVLGRTLDNLGVEPSVFNTGQQLNALGKDKETFAQSSLRGLGVSVRPVDPQLELRNKVKAYQYEKRKLETARRQIFKDRNLSPESRASKVREMNEQIKLLNQKHREELYGE